MLDFVLLLAVILIGYLYFSKHLNLKEIEGEAQATFTKAVSDLEAAAVKAESEAKSDIAAVVSYLKSKI